MLTLSTPKAEALCRVRPREFDDRKLRNQLPFPTPQRARYSKQSFTPVQCFFILIQNQIIINWDVSTAEAAHLVRMINNKVSDSWDLVRRDAFLVKVARTDGFADVWICDSAGLREFITEPPQEEFQWSPETLAVEAEMRGAGASDAEIGAFMMAAEGERLTQHYRRQPRKYWVLHLTGIMDQMEQTAKDLGFALPPRTDRAAWFGGK